MSGIFTQETLFLILRLIYAMALASVFGLERERRNRAAGLRTHMLVTLGAALLTMISESYAREVPGFRAAEPDRITAQIVSGIGFLGAGTIIVRGGSVRGLTTAASLWVAAAIGIAVGRGGEFFFVAAAVSLLVLFILTVLDWLEEKVVKKHPWRQLTIGTTESAGSDAMIAELLGEMKVQLQRVERQLSHEPDLALTTFTLLLPPGMKTSQLEAKVLGLPGIRRIEWD